MGYKSWIVTLKVCVIIWLSLHTPLFAADLSLRLLPEIHQANTQSPFHSDDSALLRSELLLNWQHAGWTLSSALSAERDSKHNQTADAHLNELFYETSLGDWEFSIGQKRLGWGMGYGFRPLDTIQHEPRRALQPLLLDGIPSLILEKFTEDSSISLIYAARIEWNDWQVNDTTQSGTLRLYRFVGNWEFMGLGAWEQERGLTLGAGFSLVQGDHWKFHGEFAWREHYQKWRSHLLDKGELIYAGNPMYQQQDDNAWQVLLGTQWTHHNGTGILLEYWYDGSAWQGSNWEHFLDLTYQQQAALRNPNLPTQALQSNLAAAEQAYLNTNQLRHNLLLRLSHDNGKRSFAVEYLFTPEDKGGTITLLLEDNSLDKQKIRLGARMYSGTNDASYGALPQSLVIFATWEMGWKL